MAEEMKFTIHYTDGNKKFEYLDAYGGTQSLFGITQLMLISFHAFFNKEIISKATAAKGFSVVLGVSRRGSWDQVVNLVVSDQNVIDLIKDMGKNAIYDLFKYVLLSGVVIPFVLTSRKARKRMRELERENDDLQEKLDEALKRAHAPVRYQGLDVHVMSGKTILAEFNEDSLRYIDTEIVSDEVKILECAISRFNARTGTGRLIRDIDSVSIPFFPVDKLSEKQASVLADNLGLVTRNEFSPIRMSVSSVTDAGGRVKRYKLHHVFN